MTRFQDRVALLGAEVEMMQGFQKEGGAAFPIDTANVTFYGMSMRDYFAARSLAGLCANPGGPFQANGMCGWSIVNCTTDQVAQECYRLADSMLKARGSETVTVTSDDGQLSPSVPAASAPAQRLPE